MEIPTFPVWIVAKLETVPLKNPFKEIGAGYEKEKLRSNAI
jgi:hypothetical protein